MSLTTSPTATQPKWLNYYFPLLGLGKVGVGVKRILLFFYLNGVWVSRGWR